MTLTASECDLYSQLALVPPQHIWGLSLAPHLCFSIDDVLLACRQPFWKREYGAQDFIGLIDEMRLWKVVRTPEQIKRVRPRSDLAPASYM
jgi:hypothetical protein